MIRHYVKIALNTVIILLAILFCIYLIDYGDKHGETMFALIATFLVLYGTISWTRDIY